MSGFDVDALLDEVADRVLERLEPLLAPVPAAESWRLVGVNEVAATLGRSKRWVHGAIKERGLPYVRLDGGALAFDLELVKVWALARSVPALDDTTLAARLQPTRYPASAAGPRGARRTGKQRVAS